MSGDANLQGGMTTQRRTLGDDERRELWERLARRWQAGSGFWHPLCEGTPPPDVLAFDADYFETMGGVRILREALAERGISRVLQLHELSTAPLDSEIDVAVLEPSAGDGEQYSTSASADWLVYASHENSITIAGDWLVEVFKQRWPDWRDGTWETRTLPKLRGDMVMKG